jgi:hypothetical protein
VTEDRQSTAPDDEMPCTIVASLDVQRFAGTPDVITAVLDVQPGSYACRPAPPPQ